MKNIKTYTIALALLLSSLTIAYTPIFADGLSCSDVPTIAITEEVTDYQKEENQTTQQDDELTNDEREFLQWESMLLEREERLDRWDNKLDKWSNRLSQEDWELYTQKRDFKNKINLLKDIAAIATITCAICAGQYAYDNSLFPVIYGRTVQWLKDQRFACKQFKTLLASKLSLPIIF